MLSEDFIPCARELNALSLRDKCKLMGSPFFLMEDQSSSRQAKNGFLELIAIFSLGIKGETATEIRQVPLKISLVSQHRKDSEITLCQREPFSKEGHHEYHPLHFSQDMVDQSFFTHGLQLFFQDFSIKTSTLIEIKGHHSIHSNISFLCSLGAVLY